MRNIHVRIAEDGWSAPYWKPETIDLPEPSADTASMWQTASNAVAWLNSTNAASDHETAMRLMKLTEEAGEVMQAYIGLQGQNPRKGQTHTADDVAAELCDVILTAAVALEHHMRRVDKRMRQMVSATFPCGCRTGQGCTCPYPSASEEQQ
ncbi:MazG-like family protein [Streptomyces kronopolitis]|uniref:MazG-like family protein n=1 Tax=Streptomyces kronopolitis TaxID=1612435 RepID=UPI003D98972F